MQKNRRKYRHSHEPHPLKPLLTWLSILLSAGAVLGGFWFLSKLGPRDVDYRDIQVATELAEGISALREESVVLESQFEEILAMREPESEDFLLIIEALEKQQAYLEATGAIDSEAVTRAKNLEERYHELASVRPREESLALEEEAAALVDSKEYEAARAKYLEALESQLIINREFPLSAAFNQGRAARLEQQARYLQAEPFWQRSMALEKEAEKFIEAREWQQAEAKLQQAIELQDHLNQEFRGSNQASAARLERLRIRRVGIRSGRGYFEIEEVAALADQRRAEVANLEAADLYLKAARLQEALNENYPESPYASSERVAEFLRKAETEQSYELGLTIESNHRRLIRLLGQRRTHEAAEVLVRLRQEMRQLRVAYPKSSLNDEALQLKVRYLNLVQNKLGFIQDRVYAALLPIDGESEWEILRSEVTQALYSLVMGVNPSRNVGATKPVDSVSWKEAKSFCERLSWIMGKPVRLPTENEFRQSLGQLRYVVLEEHVWSASATDGSAQPVAQKSPFESGCFDLLGNVSEWLESIDRFENEDARHIGGHAQDRLETIFTVPVREAARGERNRLIGFRFVVKVE